MVPDERRAQPGDSQEGKTEAQKKAKRGIRFPMLGRETKDLWALPLNWLAQAWVLARTREQKKVEADRRGARGGGAQDQQYSAKYPTLAEHRRASPSMGTQRSLQSLSLPAKHKHKQPQKPFRFPFLIGKYHCPKKELLLHFSPFSLFLPLSFFVGCCNGAASSIDSKPCGAWLCWKQSSHVSFASAWF